MESYVRGLILILLLRDRFSLYDLVGTCDALVGRALVASTVGAGRRGLDPCRR